MDVAGLPVLFVVTCCCLRFLSGYFRS